MSHFFPCVTVFFHHLAFASILKMYGICRLAACVRLMCFILKSPDSQCEWACTFTLRRKTNQPLSIKLRVITNTKHSCVIICVHTHRNSFTRSFSTLLWVDRDISNQYASIHKPKYLYLMSNICKHLEVCMCYSRWWWIRFHPSMRVHTHTRAWKALYSCSSSLLSISFLPHPPAFLLPPCLIPPHTLSSTDPLFPIFLLVDCIHTAVEAALLCGSQAW